MSDTTTVTNRDFLLNVGSTFDGRALEQAQAEVKKTVAEFDKAAAKPARFDAREQAVRDSLSGRLRAIRANTQRSQISEEVNRRLFGGPDPNALTDDLRERIVGNFDRDAGFRRANGGGAFDEAPSGPRPGAGGGGGNGGGGGLGGFARERATAEKGFFKRLKEESDGIEGAAKLWKGIGALGIVTDVGRAMQKLPEVVDAYRENLKLGMTKSQALATSFAEAIPVVGELAKGFRGIKDAADKVFFPERFADEARKQELKDNREAVQKQAADNAKRRLAFTNPADDAIFESRLKASTTGLHGGDLASREALNEFLTGNRGLDKEAQDAKAAKLTTEQQDKFDKDLAERRAQLLREYTEKQKQITADAFREEEQKNDEHQQALEEKQADGERDRLESQGRFFTARLFAIRDAANKEVAEADKSRKDQQKDLDPASPQYKSAQKRFEEDRDAIRRRQREQEGRANEEDQRDREKAEERSADAVKAVRLQAITSRLRAAGDEADAEKVQLEAQHEDRVKAIKDQFDDEVKLHAERRGQLEKDRDAALAAEGDSFSASVAEQRAARARQFRATPFAPTEESRLVSGRQSVGATFADQRANEQAAQQKDIHGWSREMRDFLSNIDKALKANGIVLKVAKV